MYGFNSKRGGGKLPKDKRIFVDPVNGNDTSGQKYREDKPFATIQAAANVFANGDVIECTGDIVISSSVTFPNTASLFVLDFKEGCTVTGNFANTDPIFTTDNGVNYEIHGRGVFHNPFTGSPGSSATRVFSMGASSAFEIYGAKRISTYGGRPINPSGWLNIRNVDQIYSENFISFNTGYRSDRDGVNYGFIENCVFKRPDGTGAYFLQATTGGQKIVFNDCEFSGGGSSGGCILVSGGASVSYFELNRCKIVSVAPGGAGFNRAFWVINGNNQSLLNDCYVESVSGSAVLANSGNGEVILKNCRIKSGSTAITRSTTCDLTFIGVNYVDSGSTVSINSTLDVPSKNYGKIVANKVPQAVGVQVWNITGFTQTPTPGDVYTITADDGTSIDYTVQGGDTDLDVLQGLEAAAIAKASESVNDFTHFTPFIAGASPYDLRLTATDPDYNYDLNEGEAWAGSSSGADTITASLLSGNAGFAIIGGEYLIDENLTL